LTFFAWTQRIFIALLAASPTLIFGSSDTRTPVRL
jgi:hypothetical protein